MRSTPQPTQRTGFWFRQLLTTARLTEGFERVAANHGGPGVDGQRIDDFASCLDVELSTLRHEALTGTYMPRALLPIGLMRPGKKPRMLGIPSVRDRVLQTSCTMTLTPLAEREFEDMSFGYRQGRSVKQAVARITRLRDEGFVYVVDADITAFFDEIPHAPLLDRVDAMYRDGLLTRLVRQWLEAPVFRADGEVAAPRTRGIAQGSPLSPLLANIYLDQLDEAMLAEGLCAVRYADDFVVLCKSPERAEAALTLTREVLAAMQLRLHADKTRVASFQQGFRFLGALFVRSLVMKARLPEDAFTNATATSALTADAPPPRLSHGSAEPRPPLWLADHPLESALAVELREALAAQPIAAASEGEDVVEPVTDVVATVNAIAADTDIDSPTLVIDSADVVDHGIDSSPSSDGLSDATNAPHASENLLQTLYVVTPNTEVAREGESLVMRPPVGDEVRLPANRVDLVVLIGQNRITTPAMQLCLSRDIPLALVGRNGRYYGMLTPSNVGYVALQLAQVARHHDAAFGLTIAKNLVRSKLENTATVLQRVGRRHRGTTAESATAVNAACVALRELAQRTKTCAQVSELMGVEGSGARRYFDAMRTLLPAALGFATRQARPAPCPVNALLSFGYTLLYQNAAAFLQARGLNPALGFLHVASAQHQALASDAMEPLRAVMVDAVVWDLLLNQRISGDAKQLGKAGSDGSFRLNVDVTKVFLGAIEARMVRSVNYAVGRETSGDGRRLIDAHVRALVHAIRNADAESFAPVALR